MSLSRLVNGTARPAAACCLVLLAAAVLLVLAGAASASLDRLPELFWGAAGAAAGLLLAVLLAPPRLHTTIRGGGLAGAGLCLTILQGNGFTDGAARMVLVGAVAVAFLAAVPALLLRIESAQHKPVRRL
ncbi:MAG: hypothetical protein ACRCXL_03935 [Dermatophilaceae bacterium]